MKYKYQKSTNKLIEVAELPLRLDETGKVQLIELEWIGPELADGTILDESEISDKQKSKSNPCKNWSECTAKEPRHCALEGCQKEIQEKADIANEDFRCGEGDNRCNCHHPSQCGYIPIMKMENEIFGDINLVHGGENGKDDQHITDETLSAKLRNDLVSLAGINGDEQVMEAAYKAAKQAFLLKETRIAMRPIALIPSKPLRIQVTRVHVNWDCAECGQENMSDYIEEEDLQSNQIESCKNCLTYNEIKISDLYKNEL